MHCAVDIDSSAHNNDHPSLDSGLDRALDRGEVVELYAHHPGDTVAIADLEYVLAGAKARGLDFITYEQFGDPNQTPRPGLALSFDDTSIAAWHDQLPLFAQYGAHVTFFVSRYTHLTDAEHAELHELANDGDAIEPHTVLHLRAPEYVEQRGVEAYLDEEFQPSLDVLLAEGYQPTTFAYPFGSRTDETDRALLGRIQLLRSVAFTVDVDRGPCPR